MYEFEVVISDRPLGVKFAHVGRGGKVVVQMALEGMHGAKLGLLPGDMLMAVNGKSVEDRTSTQALDEFRCQDIPYRATFRRFDEKEDENEPKETQFMKEEVNHLISGLASTPHSKSSKGVPLREWTVEDVVKWLSNYGRALGTPERFEKYHRVIVDKQINGNVLKGLDRIDLANIGIEDDDAHDLFIGIRELNSIIQIPITPKPPSSPSKNVTPLAKDSPQDKQVTNDVGLADDHANDERKSSFGDEIKENENWE
ncbi:hypothetical protein RFI_06282, partial [Reticulomyxa filosa]